MLPIAAKHHTQLYISGSLTELALGALIISYGAIAMLIRKRGSTAAVRLLHGADAEETVFGLDGDIVGADVSAAFASAASAEYAAMKASGATERTVHHPVMDMPGGQLLGFRIGGLTLHTCDVARGAGGDETLDSELVEDQIRGHRCCP